MSTNPSAYAASAGPVVRAVPKGTKAAATAAATGAAADSATNDANANILDESKGDPVAIIGVKRKADLIAPNAAQQAVVPAGEVGGAIDGGIGGRAGDEDGAAGENKDDFLPNFNCRPVSDFQKLARLGEGSYGTVYSVRNRVTNEVVALKKLRLTSESTGFHLTSLREISILKSLKHPNVIEMKEVVVGKKPDYVFLVFEQCAYDLATVIDKTGERFSQSEIKTLMLQLLSAVAYLHKRFIIHRDIKLSNLLLTSKGVLKLGDFGLARQTSHPLRPMTPNVYTLWYRAPELLLHCEQYHTSADMWALGCVFGELVLNSPLLPGRKEHDQMKLIAQLLGTPNVDIWPSLTERLDYFKSMNIPEQDYHTLDRVFHMLSPEGVDLISRMLVYDPSRRITAAQALQHPWFLENPPPCPPSMMPVFKLPQESPVQSAQAAPSAAANPPIPPRQPNAAAAAVASQKQPKR